MIRPWLFLFPAMFALGLYLAYPVVETLRLSLTDRERGRRLRRAGQLRQMFGEDKFWERCATTFLWLIVVPAARPPSACWRRS
jgi:alpha-glucoside transport system permease protein